MANYGMLGALPPGLRGLVAAEQMSQQRGQNQLGQLGGILSLQNSMRQQAMAEQMAPLQMEEAQLRLNSLRNPGPKWKVEDRFNESTGKKERVMVDMNNPANVIPFGGQEARNLSFQNTGGGIVGLDPTTGVPASAPIPVSLSPQQQWQQNVQFPQQQAMTARGQNITLAGMNRPVLSEAAGGFVTPPQIGVGGLPPMGGGQAPQAGPQYGPAVRGAFGMGAGPQASPQAAAPGPQVTPVPGMAPKAVKTPGQDAVDREFAKEYVAFKASGGFADTIKQLEQLSEASNTIATGDLTGPIVGNMPDWARAVTNPQAVATKEAVQEVAQRNLRLVLGAQFTEKEGERLIARVYNDRLPAAENKKRVDRLIQQIQSAARAKQDASDYFEQKGTLTGWNGRLYTIDDFRNMDFEGKNPSRRKDDVLKNADAILGL